MNIQTRLHFLFWLLGFLPWYLEPKCPEPETAKVKACIPVIERRIVT